MKSISWFVLAGPALVLFPTTLLAQSTPTAPARAAIVEPIEEFLRGLREKDGTKLMSNLDPNARFTLLRPGPDGVRVWVLEPDRFVQLVTGPDQGPIDEPIRNLVVQVDGDLATVWAEYQVRADGAVSHCGHDAFDLVRREDEWKILNVSDTFRREGCGEPWPGPELVRP